MKFETAIKKCIKGKFISNDNMKKEYLEYDKSEKRLKWWDSRRKPHSYWSYPEDKNSKDFIKKLNMEWYECDDNGSRLNTEEKE